ncbi:glycoside hydrolase family 68 protein [Zymobacter sp. IVIA_12111.31 C1]|uniref:glycoside hydrolase family 68 protein n=1 Tax=Zymobacter sp. IVIA_12111.31 C1 TaxID=3394854 RepID=UPI0039C32174
MAAITKTTSATNSAATISHWTREQALSFKPTEANTFPEFDNTKIQAFMEGFDIWDSWFALDENGDLASIEGFRVLCALGLKQADNRKIARINYFYSKDGHSFIPGGLLFPRRLFSDIQEWSGSTLLRNDGRVQTFYTTAMGHTRDGIWQTFQRLATAIQRPSVKDGVLTFSAPEYHDLLLEPDGVFYQNVDQADDAELRMPTLHNRSYGNDQVNNLCFRDPFFFKDPATQKNYLLFEANTGPRNDAEGTVRRDYIGSDDFEANYRPTVDDLKANGCVGVAEFTDDQYTKLSLLPPILTSNLITDEIERVTLIYRDSSYYLFCVTHGNKMTILDDTFINRDMMLGFKASSMFGPYAPLNGSGVVVQQKSEGAMYTAQASNYQYVYSWNVLPDLSVLSYANYSYSAAEDRMLYTKTVGPRIHLSLQGTQTEITGLDYGFVLKTATQEAQDTDEPVDESDV